MERYKKKLWKIRRNQGICPHGASCDRKKKCKWTHPHQIDCQHGTACKNIRYGCPFIHDLPRVICPNGVSCLDKTCPFVHRSH